MSNTDSEDPRKGFDGSQGPENTDSSRGQGDPDAMSDEEVRDILKGFEGEFGDSDMPGAASAATDTDSETESAGSDASGLSDDELSEFSDQLEGVLGNKAKCAIIITQLRSARFLAALCSLTDISAQCIDSQNGACAVLRELDGSGPEDAARGLTEAVNGLAAVLAVNRADKVDMHLWVGGKEGTSYAPPIILSSAPLFVEDMLTGSLTVQEVISEGTHVEDSGSISKVEAYGIIGENLK